MSKYVPSEEERVDMTKRSAAIEAVRDALKLYDEGLYTPAEFPGLLARIYDFHYVGEFAIGSWCASAQPPPSTAERVLEAMKTVPPAEEFRGVTVKEIREAAEEAVRRRRDVFNSFGGPDSTRFVVTREAFRALCLRMDPTLVHSTHETWNPLEIARRAALAAFTRGYETDSALTPAARASREQDVAVLREFLQVAAVRGVPFLKSGPE